jgi:deaminated glutathione amidase
MTAMQGRIAILQMTSGIDVFANTAAIKAAIKEAAAGGAQMLFTPEMALLLDRDRSRASRHVGGAAIADAIAELQEHAARHALWLHIGSAPIADPAIAPRWANRAFIIDSTGTLRATYDKLHMFDVELSTGETWRESTGFAAGNQAVAINGTPLGQIGVSICYDLRFGALYDLFGASGCNAIAIPAAFTVPTGTAHWHILLRARAIEQGCYVIAAAQCGKHADGRTTYGHSLVIGPWGDIIIDMGAQPGLVFADLDLALVAETRAQLPSIRHRRLFPDGVKIIP